MTSSFGARLDALLRERGVSGRALARELKVDKSTVVDWRLDRHLPRHEQLIAIASALNVPVSRLVADATERQPETTTPAATHREQPSEPPGGDADQNARQLIARLAQLRKPLTEAAETTVPDLLRLLADAEAYVDDQRRAT
jgi:transcriptional regulator with XRE-family HTH domain